MLISKRAIKVDKITISGEDIERLRNLCEFMEDSAKNIIEDYPNDTTKIQNMITFCRNVLKEFE